MTAYLYNPLWKSLRDAVVNAINIAGGNVSQGSYTANASGVIAALQQLISQIQALNTASTNAQTTATAAQTTANTAQTIGTTAQTLANTAQNTANTAQAAANTAQTTANTAQTNLSGHIAALGGVHGLSAMFSPLGIAGSGRFLQYGSAAPSGSLSGPYSVSYFRDLSVTFPTAYTVTPRVAVSSAAPAGAWNVTLTGFTLRVWVDASWVAGAFSVDWIAVGG